MLIFQYNFKNLGLVRPASRECCRLLFSPILRRNIWPIFHDKKKSLHDPSGMPPLQALQTFQQLDDVCEISEPDGRRQIYHCQMFYSKEIVVG